MALVRVGLVGLGGHAGFVCEQLLALKREQSPPLRLEGVYEPMLPRFSSLAPQLEEAGIATHKTYQALIQSDIDAVWLPVPIDLHRRMVVQATAAGKAVLCEKPAAGCVQDVDAMIAARDRTGQRVAVAFQDIYAESTQVLKRMILSGEVGEIERVTLTAAWPRGQAYFARSWAGRLQRNGVWVLDSVANNAMSHFLHLVMYLLGPTPQESASPAHVEAELYRANAIENYDTCALRMTLRRAGWANEIRFVALLTHASREVREPVIVLEGTRGQIRYQHGIRMAWVQRRTEGRNGHAQVPLVPDPHAWVPRGFATYLHDAGAPHASLEMSRHHAVVVSGASEAAPVVSVPLEFIERVPPADGSEEGSGLLKGLVGGGGTGGGMVRCIAGIEDLIDAAASKHQLFHETGQARWTSPAKGINLEGYSIFRGPAGS
jgi:predicted dehydrogenase